MAKINERIKQRRIDLGYTLLFVAEKLDIQEATMQRYESGAIKNIKHETISKLAEILNCNPAYLMGWTDEPTLTNNSNNHGVIGDVNGGAVTIKNGHERTLTTQEQDILRIYNNSDGKTQMKIMSFIYDIEENNKKVQN